MRFDVRVQSVAILLLFKEFHRIPFFIYVLGCDFDYRLYPLTVTFRTADLCGILLMTHISVLGTETCVNVYRVVFHGGDLMVEVSDHDQNSTFLLVLLRGS